MSVRTLEYKPLLFTTTVRNPERVKYFLYVFAKFDGQTLTNDLATKIVVETIRYGLYRPTKKTASIQEKWENSPQGTFGEQLLTDEEVEYIIENNPQKHKEAGFAWGYPSRFATIFDFTKELGFVYFTPNAPIQFSQLGKMLAQVFDITIVDSYINVEIAHPEYEQKAFMQSLAKYQRKNPFVRVSNDNIPLILLAQVIGLLNKNPDFRTSKDETKGIAKHELPLLIFWKNNDAYALYDRIVKLRKEYGYNPSDEVICDICINEIMQGFKAFKQKSIMEEYPDEFIRKMRITNLFSLRGAGRFLDINNNETEKITYIINQYSDYKYYTDEQEYFNYMSEIDTHLFEVTAKPVTENQAETLLQNWSNVYSWETIKKELVNLQKRAASKDDVLKFLSAPVRLEFLTALSIKSKLPNVRVIPNYTCDDSGLPTSTAGGGIGDIECYENTNAILIEVTMSEGRTQTMMEIWPVERHLSDFQDKTNNHAQAVFIAPTIFSDSQRQIDYVKFSTQKVIRPYTIEDFIQFINETETLYVSNT